MKHSTVLRKKILIIDDNVGILFAVRKALEVKGYEVITSETFPGVTYVENISPDLLLLDVSLVGQDGRQVAKELKADNKTNRIPIVMLTAYPNARELALEAGADDFLSKPFELKDLWNISEKYTSIPERMTTLGKIKSTSIF